MTDGGDYQIGFSPFVNGTSTLQGDPATTMPSTPAKVAAIMLEEIPADGAPVDLRSFQRTRDTNTVPLAICEDTDGSTFRASSWTRDCVRLGNAGFSSNCSDGPLSCFRQASFGISQAAIQNGKVFNFSGFARGNFNYRIDQVALNLSALAFAIVPTPRCRAPATAAAS